ncbi:MAG: transposase family protein [Chloroflexi bacterium]|nr:transposase family protein [Chloroflexota bacterium]
MAETDPMTIDERRKYLHRMRIRYWQTKQKSERSRLLDEMQAVTGLHRKSLLRLINGELARKPRRKQRGKIYGTEVEAAISKIAQSLDYPCAERLKPNLVWMANHLEAHGELSVTAKLREQLGTISVSSLRRRLPASERATQRIAHRKGQPRPSFAQKQSIPIRRIDWDERWPGHFEVDLVHHCGLSAEGQYLHTLQMLDVATGWCECVGVLGRSYLVMQDGFERISHRLPFEIRELHPDNGTEFLNAHLLRYWQDKVKAELSRSRPYHKNDNRFVEENNFSLVRAYIGYGRLETVAQVKLLNQLYDQLWLYHNFFQPVMRLSEKHWQEHRVKRIYDDALPPFDRLCKTDILPPARQLELETLRQKTNPIRLRDDIQTSIDRLYALPGLKEGVVEDVRLSLFDPQAVLAEL